MSNSEILIANESTKCSNECLCPKDANSSKDPNKMMHALEKLVATVSKKQRYEFLKNILKSMNEDDREELLKNFIDKDIHDNIILCDKCGVLMLDGIEQNLYPHPACTRCKKVLCIECSGFQTSDEYYSNHIDRFWSSNNEKYDDLVCLSCESSDDEILDTLTIED
jgi:hypothetical protein